MQHVELTLEYDLSTGKPYGDCQDQTFREMLNKFYSKYTIISRETYEGMTMAEFHLYCEYVGDYLRDELKRAYDIKFATFLHDCFTAASKSDIIGGSVVFIDHRWNYVIIPMIFVVNDDSHSAENVAAVAASHVNALYDVSISDFCCKAVNDTANAAKAVAQYLVDSGLNINCEMHVANLVLGYGSGLHENYWMQVPSGEDSNTPKVRTFVTE